MNILLQLNDILNIPVSILVATLGIYILSKMFTRDVLDGLEEGGEGGVDTFRIQEVIMNHKTG